MKRRRRSSQRNLMIGTAAILAAAVLLAFLLGRGLSRPLAAITAVMNRLSSGDTDVTIPGADRKDELGTMAATVDVFRRNMIEANSLREAQEAAKQQAEVEKKALQRQMADRFEADVKSVVARGRAGDPGHAARRQRDHRPASTAPRSAPRPRPPPPKKHPPASTRSPPRPRNWPLRWPRSAARSPIPATSPTAP